MVEDDYDSEFRYASRALASLQGLDTEGRVVYVGTFREDDHAAAARAAEAGIDLHPLSRFWLGHPGRSGLLLGYAGYGTREIWQGIERLASVL